MLKRIIALALISMGCQLAFPQPASKPSEALASRLVVVGGDLTEIVFALNKGGQVVAIDDSSTYPAKVKNLPSVGYVRALSTEGVLSVKPDQLILSAHAGPKPVVKQLQQAGIALVKVTQIPTVEGIKKKIKTVSAFLNVPEEGKKLSQQIDKNMQALQQQLAKQKNKHRKAIIFMGMQSGQLMAAGKGTKANAVLKLLQLNNPMQHKSYKPLSQEALLKVNPDIIIVAVMPNQAHDKSAFMLTGAYQNGNIFFVDSAALLSFGPRLPETLLQLVDDMQKTSHPLAKQ